MMKSLDLTEENIKMMTAKGKIILNLLKALKSFALENKISVSDSEMDSILKRILWE